MNKRQALMRAISYALEEIAKSECPRRGGGFVSPQVSVTTIDGIDAVGASCALDGVDDAASSVVVHGNVGVAGSS